MLEKIAIIAVWIIVPICILFFPHICSAIYFAFVVVIVADGRPDLVLRTVLPFAAVLFLLLELSPVAGPVWAAKSSFLKDKRKRLLTHIGVMFVVVFGALISMSQIGLHNKAENGTIGILFSFIICPAIGFAIGLGALLFRRYLFEDEEGFEKKRLEEERIQQEAAAAEAERVRIKEEREREKAESIAKAKAQREAEAKRAKDNKAAVLSFWDVLISEYRIDPAWKTLVFGDKPINFDLSSEEVVVWVRNDERIKKIEDIVRSAGFHIGSTINGQLSADVLPNSGFEKEEQSAYDFVSTLLETVLYDDFPIKYGAYDTIQANFGKQTISGDGWVLPDAYTFGVHDGIDNAIGFLNSRVKQIFSVYRKEYEIMKSGLKGEYAVQQVLDLHAGSFIVLHDLRLEFPNSGPKPDSVEIDTLVLAVNGIFAIEVKNYGESGRYKIIVTSDGNWYKEYPARFDGESPKREVMNNPFAQNDRHIAFLERFVNECLGRGMADWAYVENIICIANDEVTLENDPGAKQTLTRVSNLYNQLTQNRTPIFTVDELQKLKSALESRSLPGKKYPLPDHSENLRRLVNYYGIMTRGRFQMLMAASQCAKDHPEFLTMIQ